MWGLFDVIVVLVFGAFILTLSCVWGCQFAKAKGSTWQRMLAASFNSATILWSYLVAIGAAILAFISALAEVLGMTEVRDMIQKTISAEFLGITLAGIMVITIIARLRTILVRDSREDDEE